MTNYFDGPVAAAYDEDPDPRFTPEALARECGFLADLAGPGGRALELAIGTGRVALPLAARGITVSGIELSEPMVERLRAKPGGGDIPVLVGDMAAVGLDATQRGFDLVYLVFNTLGNLVSGGPTGTGRPSPLPALRTSRCGRQAPAADPTATSTRGRQGR